MEYRRKNINSILKASTSSIIPEEEWKNIPNYEGLYQASNLGNIKRLRRSVRSAIKNNKSVVIPEKILAKTLDTYGYPIARLVKNGIKKSYSQHRIIAITFIPNPQNKSQVNHINGIKSDNRVENLEWVTSEENIIHGVNNRLFKHSDNHPMAKLVERQIIEIRNKYKPRIYTFQRLADEYGVTKQNIIMIVKRKSWGYLK